MSRAGGERFHHAGWRFLVPQSASAMSPDARTRLVEMVLATASGKAAPPFRRSRHATTWRVEFTDPAGERTMMFIKQLDPVRGLANRTRMLLRMNRVEHVVRISEQLRRDGFAVPQIAVAGYHLATGREVIAMAKMRGFMLTRWMRPDHGTTIIAKRAILRALGGEVARLHATGYIHGDLTPYNVIVTGEEPVRIAFIDHERTGRASRLGVGVARQRMRNLVQLGHFETPGVSRTDKMRVFRSYVDSIGLPRGESLRKLAKMIQRRVERDRVRVRNQPRAAIIAEEGHAGGA